MSLIANPYRIREADVYNGTVATRVRRLRRHRRYSLVAAVLLVFFSINAPFEVTPIAIAFITAMVLVAGWHFLLSSGENSVNAYRKVFPELVGQVHS